MFTRKIYAYITHGARLLVFRHVDYPEAGLQVPGGTVEPGESFQAALWREVREETGMGDGLKLVGLVGEQKRRTLDLGVNETQHQKFFHLTYSGDPPERWRHTENHASDGSGPLVFEFSWSDLETPPELAGVQGAFIGRLTK